MVNVYEKRLKQLTYCIADAEQAIENMKKNPEFTEDDIKQRELFLERCKKDRTAIITKIEGESAPKKLNKKQTEEDKGESKNNNKK